MRVYIKKYFLTLGIFSGVFFIDRLAKVLALFFLYDSSTVIVPHFLSLRLVLNENSFFSYGWGWIGVLLFFVLLFFQFRKNEPTRMHIFFSVIMSGAFSNFLDVMRYRAVIDWIEIPGFTIFNIADCAIVLGCVGLLISLINKKT